jgi:processive 1,2-diacylglycerol beta-glucosyltransferase
LKILILSCSTGQGHNTAAEAVFEALTARGAACTLIDPIALKSERAARNVAKTYIKNAVVAPYAFGMLYQLGSLISSDRGRSPVYWANALYAPELEAYIENGGYDAVVTTHLYSAEALTFLKRHGRLHVPAYAVLTDYACSPFWEETRPDVCFTPSDAVSDLCAGRGMPRAMLVATGIPVRRASRERIGRQAARARVGIESGAHLIVVMGGSMGGGKMIAIVRELLKRAYSDTVVAALCGNNETLAKRLNERFAQDDRLRLVGYTKEVPLWMEACDVLLTKPGGLTSTEAAVKGVPLVLTAPIPGCETQNAAYFHQRGIARRAFRPAEAADQAMALLDNEIAQHAMRNRQRRTVAPPRRTTLPNGFCVHGRRADMVVRPILDALACVAAGFASGGVLYCVYLPLLFKGIDVTKVSEDKNPGTFNAFQYAGVPLGILCLACELAKGYVPVLLSMNLVDPASPAFAAIMLAPVAGHAFSPLKRFQGGKGIAVSFGVLLALVPRWLVVFVLAGRISFRCCCRCIQMKSAPWRLFQRSRWLPCCCAGRSPSSLAAC